MWCGAYKAKVKKDFRVEDKKWENQIGGRR